MSECAYQFRFDKWNCPESAFNLNPVTNKGTSSHPPSRQNPLIPEPSARIGSLKLNLDDKSAMHLSGYKYKGRKDKPSSMKDSRVDAFDILNPSNPFKSTSNANHDEANDYDLQANDHQNIRQINRELALVRAMTSAGITHTLTKNCSTGDFTNCVCDRYNYVTYLYRFNLYFEHFKNIII